MHKNTDTRRISCAKRNTLTYLLTYIVVVLQLEHTTPHIHHTHTHVNDVTHTTHLARLVVNAVSCLLRPCVTPVSMAFSHVAGISLSGFATGTRWQRRAKR